MVLLGAKGITAMELLKGLGFDDSVDVKLGHEHHQSLLCELIKAHEITFKIANKLFIEQSYQMASIFLEDSAKFYQSRSESLDFANDFEKSRLHINNWVKDKTESKILNLLPPGSLDALTRFVVANAIYFKGDWMYKFAEEKTQPFNFYVDENQVSKVQMMTQKKVFGFKIDHELGIQAVCLPYKDKTVSMILLVPIERFGLKLLEENLCFEKMKNLTNVQAYINREVILFLPRMKLEFSLDLIPVLKNLGIHDVFVNQADLSGMSDQHDLYVGGVYHKAFLEVNEKGTEAAAATAVVARSKSAFPSKPKPIRITCDHPFLFLIIHDLSNSILFMGRYVSPSPSDSPVQVYLLMNIHCCSM